MRTNAVSMPGAGDLGIYPGYWDDIDSPVEHIKCTDCGNLEDPEDLDDNGHCPECQAYYLENPEELEP